jgi:hypothetical protein
VVSLQVGEEGVPQPCSSCHNFPPPRACFPQDDESVNAEQCINKASLLIGEKTDPALMLQHKVCNPALPCVRPLPPGPLPAALPRESRACVHHCPLERALMLQHKVGHTSPPHSHACPNVSRVYTLLLGFSALPKIDSRACVPHYSSDPALMLQHKVCYPLTRPPTHA